MEALTVWFVAYGEAYEGYKLVPGIPARTSYIAQQRAARRYAEEHLVWGNGAITRDEHEDGSIIWSQDCDRVYLFSKDLEV